MTELNREEKGQVVAAVVERLGRTETVVVADFRGLTVAQLAELRRRLREAEAEMTVVKNTLSRRAVDEADRPALRPYLEGPTGLVWVDGDAARAAKALSDFAREHEVFSIRGGVLGAGDLPAASIRRLASLPSRDQMLTQLAGGLAAPLSGLAGRLVNLVGNLARTLSAVRDSGALAPAEGPRADESTAPPAPAEPDASLADATESELAEPDSPSPAAEGDGVDALDEPPAQDARDAESATPED